jgi:hypothetical protein
MLRDIERVLIDRERIAARVREIAAAMSADFARDTAHLPEPDRDGRIVRRRRKQPPLGAMPALVEARASRKRREVRHRPWQSFGGDVAVINFIPHEFCFTKIPI